jgi:Kef-type K+ transport system membrane component KefB
VTEFEFLPRFPLPVNPLALFGVLLLAGVLCGEFTRRVLNLPRITGYVLSGLALGSSGLGLLDATMRDYARVFVDIGLGLVLFELGMRLDLAWLNRDRWLAMMAGAECVLSFACMFGALVWFDISPLHAAVAAAVGVSSSPAVVLLVARELKAEGQVTERSLNLVAINSVVAVLALTMLLSWIHQEYQSGPVTMVLHPLYLLLGSLLLGLLAAHLTLDLARWLQKRVEQHAALLLAMIVFLVGASSVLKLSILMVMLSFGMLVRNLDDEHVLMSVDTGRLGQIFYIVLFVAIGAVLNVANLAVSGALAVVFIAARFVGKSVGVLSFAHLSGIRPGSGGLLSLALLPMSGGAMAMTLGSAASYPGFDTRLAGMVLAASLLLDLAGPLAVQFALRRAGESHEEEKT